MSSHAEFENFVFELPEYEEAAADFIGEVGRSFQDAFLKRKLECKLTQQQIAEMLDVNRSFVNRSLSGSSNMTAETMAKLAWSMGGKVKLFVVLDDDLHKSRSNYFIGCTGMTNSAIPSTDNYVRINTKQAGGYRLQQNTWENANSFTDADFVLLENLELHDHENS